MKTFPFLTAIVFFLCSARLFAGDDIQFINRTGEFALAGTKEKIVVTGDQNTIQFRIRGSGPTEPAIAKGSDWFIAVVDKDHVWAHVGAGRLFYYSWQSDSESRIDGWTYPHIGETVLPAPIRERLEKRNN